jgi:hypothetical protein
MGFLPAVFRLPTATSDVERRRKRQGPGITDANCDSGGQIGKLPRAFPHANDILASNLIALPGSDDAVKGIPTRDCILKPNAAKVYHIARTPISFASIPKKMTEALHNFELLLTRIV